jgi:hypothetical protein
MQGEKGYHGSFASARPSLERDSDEDRTSRLKSSLEGIWKKLDPESRVFKRYPFMEGAPVIPVLPRGIHLRRCIADSGG